MSPLERAARALFKAISGSDWDEETPTWANEMGLTKQDCIDGARAVLAAIREPSEAIIMGGVLDSGDDEDGIRQRWQAMIDAALAEGE